MYLTTLTPVYSLSSITLMILCLSNAYIQNSYNAKLAASYIVASKVSLIITLHAIYVILFVLGGAGMAYFIGKIRKKEFEKFQEKMVQYSGVNLLFVFYVMNSSTLHSTLTWVMWFTAVGFLKVFSIVGKERARHYTSTLVNDDLKHKKLSAILVLVLVFDLILVMIGYFVFRGSGFGFLLLSLYECWILFVEDVQTLVRYGIFLVYDHFNDADVKRQWEGRHEFCYFSEFTLECVRLLSMIAHYFHIWVVGGFSLSVIDLALFMLTNSAFDELRGHMRRLYDYWVVREAINNAYPTATREELRNQDTCSICYEKMSGRRGSTPKKIKCGHMYHLICIKQWMQQSNTCPVCREPLIAKPENVHDVEDDEHLGGEDGGQVVRRRMRPPSISAPSTSSWTNWLPFSVELVQRDDGASMMRAPTPVVGLERAQAEEQVATTQNN
ncbi:hypothetical protein AKO1_012139 [Acrasis kona]|uniref:E3 ubiquitin-protein ligase n=1 Tax=Acrasis kona TaxID=1008807 RepID=A0AAW2ZAN3_9EUKA